MYVHTAQKGLNSWYPGTFMTLTEHHDLMGFLIHLAKLNLKFSFDMSWMLKSKCHLIPKLCGQEIENEMLDILPPFQL